MDLEDFNTLAHKFVRCDSDEDSDPLRDKYTSGSAFIEETKECKYIIGTDRWSVEVFEVTLHYIFREE